MVIASSPPARPLSGPCAPARDDVDARCADAERLAQAAVAHQQRVRDVRHELMKVTAQREADARVRDRRTLSTAKETARDTYRVAVRQATNESESLAAMGAWLREIDRLNRQFEEADRRATDSTRRAAELEQELPSVELAADAARIAAESAQQACVSARRALSECEEQAQRQLQAVAPGVSDAARPVAASSSRRGVAAMFLVLRGDRKALQSITQRVAEETGLEAGRLQLLLLELREQLAAQALGAQILHFPDHHPFWSQFPAGDGRLIASNLAVMGYRFDGRSGWLDDHSPTMRELSVALSNVGLDPRALRRPVDSESINELWQGTTVEVEEFLVSRAPDLDLQDVMSILGEHAAQLGELWDMWGRLRPLLLAPA